MYLNIREQGYFQRTDFLNNIYTGERNLRKNAGIYFERNLKKYVFLKNKQNDNNKENRFRSTELGFRGKIKRNIINLHIRCRKN